MRHNYDGRSIRFHLILLAWACVTNRPCDAAQVVTYAGGGTNKAFLTACRLSDGSSLIGGWADSLDWIPADVPKTLLSADGIRWPARTDRIGFLLHLGGDAQEILQVVHFPPGAVEAVRRIRVSEVTEETPGKVFFMAVYRLRADGTDDVVEDWRVHWGLDENGKDTEAQFTPLSSRPGFRATKSGLVMKLWGRGCLRSWTQDDYDRWLPDGNGRLKKGRWPDDYYFKGPFNPAQPTHEGPGYTGYSIASPCARIGSIAVDRRNNDLYVGFSVQTRLPDGGPDFEPAVVAMTASGSLKWWSRLYHEFLPANPSAKRDDVLREGDTRTSTPDQYVDHLAVDYAGNALVVAARCHGNNVINLWAGDAVAACPGTHGFQDRFTGSNGNIHIQWLGKLALADGHLTAATYVAEYGDGMEGAGEPSNEPILDGWPGYNGGWPNLNTTRIRDMQVDSAGSVHIVAIGRRVITTANAFMKMPKKLEGVSQWSPFVRVYTPDLSGVAYSSILSGAWDPKTGEGGGNVELHAVVPTEDGSIAVGASVVDEKTRQPKGNPMTTVGVPAWGAEKPDGTSGIFAKLVW